MAADLAVDATEPVGAAAEPAEPAVVDGAFALNTLPLGTPAPVVLEPEPVAVADEVVEETFMVVGC